MFQKRSVRLYGDGEAKTGAVYHRGNAPSISGYTPVGVVGYMCAGVIEFGLNMFDCYCTTDGIVAISTKGSINSSASILVEILYIRN